MSKTKWIVFSERKLRFEHVPVKLNGVSLIMSGKVKVPRELNNMNGFSYDILISIYNSSCPGSVLWDMPS